MRIMEHDIPRAKPEPVKVYNQKSGNVGRKPTYDWDTLAPKLKGKGLTIYQAARVIGCTPSTIECAVNKGRGGMSFEGKVIV